MYATSNLNTSGNSWLDLTVVNETYNWSVFCLDITNSSNNMTTPTWTFEVNATGTPGSTPIEVTLISPPDGANIPTSDFNLTSAVNINADCTTYVWNNTGGLFSSGSVNGSGENTFMMNDVMNGNYSWNVYCVDLTNGSNAAWGNATNWTFMVAAPLISVEKTSSQLSYNYSDTVDYTINITNTLPDNLTSIWLEDQFNMALNFTGESSSSNCPIFNFSNGEAEININVTQCMNDTLSTTTLLVGESFIIKINFTAVQSGPGIINRAIVNAVDESSNNHSAQTEYPIGIAPPSGEESDEGLEQWQSSIDSPYLVKNEEKQLNFSIYRRANDQSCLANLTILLPESFTYEDYSSTGTGMNFTEDGDSLIWTNDTGDLFCGRGPEWFAINVTSTDDYTSTDFVIIGRGSTAH